MNNIPGKLRIHAGGFSLVELMISLLLAILVLFGLMTLMSSVGVTNRVQDGMARMQENGRFAMERIAADIRAASSQYCSTFAAASSGLPTGGYMYLDRGRPIISHYDARSVSSFGPVPATTANYLISPTFMLYGSECDTATCTPSLSATTRGNDPSVPATMGTAAGNRSRSSDVLSITALLGNGVPITGQTAIAPTGVVELNVNVAALGLPAAGAPVWVTDCSVADLMRFAPQGATAMRAAGNFAGGGDTTLARLDMAREPRAFNFGRDMARISYYVALKTDPNDATRSIGTLVRRVNGGQPQELIEGVERLDFVYGVDDSLGRTRYLTATQVDALADCPASPALPAGFPAGTFATPEPGCGWRSVRSIEAYMLLNTVNDVTVSNDEEFRYSWLNTGAANTAGAFENPATLGTTANGLPVGRMIRREFRVLVALRSYNF